MLVVYRGTRASGPHLIYPQSIIQPCIRRQAS
jgi:hypothetical protein